MMELIERETLNGTFEPDRSQRHDNFVSVKLLVASPLTCDSCLSALDEHRDFLDAATNITSLHSCNQIGGLI